MKPLHSIFAFMALAACLAGDDPLIVPKAQSTQVVFVGTTPCGQIIRPMHKVSQQADCALVKWTLTLYQDPVSGKPTTYKLSSINRFIVKGTNMYSEPGTKSDRTGKWSIVRNADQIIYKLETDKETSISFRKISDKLIHILDNNGRLMIGNDGWSYTLSQVANQQTK